MEEKRPTMGNLFSGSGAWELAAKICGIDAVFEAEIEPFPVALEAKRFPEAIQLGDVSKINGADIPPVDILASSSPCQDLSVAGTRKGLSAERSGLFAEAIRITKEMREHDRTDNDRRVARPQLWCWENVPGAFSSNHGEDFRTVLEEVARIANPTAVIPMPDKGKWSYAGVVEGDGWQIAWRTLDAQFFGVAQRRRRVFLVGDLAGHRATEILFERESVSWDFAEIVHSWQNSSKSLGDRIDEAGRIVRNGVRSQKDPVATGEVTAEKQP